MFLQSGSPSALLTLPVSVREPRRNAARSENSRSRPGPERGPAVPSEQAEDPPEEEADAGSALSTPTDADRLEWETCTDALRYFAAISQRLSADEQDLAVEAFFAEFGVDESVLPELAELYAEATYCAWVTAIRTLPGLGTAWVTWARATYRERVAFRFEWVGREENRSRKLEKDPVAPYRVAGFGDRRNPLRFGIEGSTAE